jgi:hypothetical protein
MKPVPGEDEVKDYLTGRKIPDIGAEANRQAVVRCLVETKGYPAAAIVRDAPLEIEVAGERYRSRIDLLVKAGEPLRSFMAIKCAAGSLGSREREIISAARIYEAHQIPLAVVSDGQNAIVLDTVSGRKLGEGLEAVPDVHAAARKLAGLTPVPYPADRREREMLIFRSYDMLNVNIRRTP